MTVGALFDEAAGGYDEARRLLVPGLDGLYAAVLEAVPFGANEPIKVLDLGAGTGLLSAEVSGRFPRAVVTLVDLSVEMLRVARRRFAQEMGRFEFRVMDFARKELPGGYDLVVSGLAIHHLTDGDKRRSTARSSPAASSSTWTRCSARRPRKRPPTRSGGYARCARPAPPRKTSPPPSGA